MSGRAREAAYSGAAHHKFGDYGMVD
jgi:hypothetical protein